MMCWLCKLIKKIKNEEQTTNISNKADNRTDDYLSKRIDIVDNSGHDIAGLPIFKILERDVLSAGKSGFACHKLKIDQYTP